MSTPPPTGPDPSEPERPDVPRLPEQQSGGHPEGYPASEPPAGMPPGGYPGSGGSTDYPGSGGFPGSGGYPSPGGYPPAGYPPPGGYGEPGGYPPSGAPPWHPEAARLPAYPGGGPGGVPTDDPLVPPDFAGWVNRVIGVFQRSLIPLAMIQAGVAVVSVIYQLTVGSAAAQVAERAAADPASFDPAAAGGFGGAFFIGGVLLGLVGVLAQAAAVYVVIRDAAGRPSTVGEALSFAGSRALPLIGWGLLAVIMVVIGTILLLLPGLYLIVVFAASFVGVIVVERAGIGRTFALVNPRLLPTAGRVAVILLVSFVLSAFIGLLTGGFGPGSALGAILSAVLSIPVGILGAGFTVVTYAELRNREDPGVGTQHLAGQLEGRGPGH